MDIPVGSKHFIAGSPYSVIDFSIEATGNDLLKIFISPNQLDFCIVERLTHRLLYLQPYRLPGGKTPGQEVKVLESIFSENEVLKHGFGETAVGVLSTDFTLFPTALSTPLLSAEWKSLFTGLAETSIILNDEIPKAGSVNVFAFPGEVKNVLDQHLGKYALQHALTPQISYLCEQNSGRCVYCGVQSGFIHVIYLEDKQLHFANVFAYHSSEDFIYFLLAIYNQFQLDREKVKLVLTGEIVKDSVLFQLLYKYIRNIEFGMPPAHLKWSEYYPFARHFYFSLFCL